MAENDDDDKKAQQAQQQKAKQEQQAQQSVTGVPTSQIPIPAPLAAPPPTLPVVPAAIPNPLTVGSTFDTSGSGDPTPSNPQIGNMDAVSKQDAAEAYRNIADTGTPEQKAVALANYRRALDASAATGTETPIGVALNRGQPLYTPPAGDEAGIAKYKGWMDAPGSLREQARAQALADQNVRAYHQAMQNAHNLERTTYDTHGRPEKPSEENLAAAMLLRQKALQEGLDSGAVDPQHIAADPNIDRARARALVISRLAKDPSTLTAISSAAAPGADLASLVESAAKNRQANEQSWLQNRRPITYNL